MQGSCLWPSTSRRWVAVIICILRMMVHLGVFTPIWVGYRSHLGGPNHTHFMYDRAYWRLRLFIILCVLRMIMDFAALGAFSVVLRAFGGSLGPLLSLLGSLPGTLGGFQGALGALLGALLGLFGAILTSQPVTPSFVGACSRLQEAFLSVLGALLGLFGVILTFKKEPPSSKQMKNRY